MNGRHLVALVLVAVALVGLAWLVSSRRVPVAVEEGPARRTPFLPELRERLRADAGSIDRIELQRGDRTTTIVRGADGWTLPDKASYPANQERVEEILRSLAGLEVDQALTSDPSRFSELGLGWPDAAGEATLVRLLAGGAPVSEVIVGRTKFTPPSVYVRRVGANETWRCVGSFAAEADAARLMQPVAVELPGPAIASIEWGDGVLRRNETGAWVAELAAPTATEGAQDADTSQPAASGAAASTADAAQGAAPGAGERQAGLARALPELFTRLEIDDVRPAGSTPAEWTVTAQIGDRPVVVEILPSETTADTGGRWVRVLVGDAQPGLNALAPPAETVAALERVRARTAGREFRMPTWRAGRLIELLAGDRASPSGQAGE